MPTFDEKVFDKAAEWIRRKKGFTASMLREPEAKAVIRETYRCLGTAVRSAVRQDTPAEVTSALESNAFEFSGLKTYHSLSEVGLSLTDDKGEIKTFDAFHHDVQAIHAAYNVNYLRAEYQHAVGSSEMALRWKDIEQDDDRYDLSYRTAADGFVRPEHAALEGTTLPPSDPFWSLYYPPNDWGCRCTAIQVPNGKYARSDSEAARAIGDRMTSSPKKQMFRFNAGKELKIFPDKHPYNKAPEQAKQIAKEIAKERESIKTPQQVVDYINESNTRKEWFERGFKTLKTTSISDINGCTDMNGNIALTQEKLDHVMSALTKIRKDIPIATNEADAMATLWHEITHNRNRIGNEIMKPLEVKYMELANEFVARKTLPEFYKALGSKVQHPEFMDNRESTGYNTWVRNYSKLIEATHADAGGVLKDVKNSLFEASYSKQKDGLVKAIRNNGAKKLDSTKLNAQEAQNLVRDCLRESEESFANILNALLIKE